MNSIIKSVGKRDECKEVEVINENNPLDNLNRGGCSVLNVNESQSKKANEKTVRSELSVLDGSLGLCRKLSSVDE